MYNFRNSSRLEKLGLLSMPIGVVGILELIFALNPHPPFKSLDSFTLNCKEPNHSLSQVVLSSISLSKAITIDVLQSRIIIWPSTVNESNLTIDNAGFQQEIKLGGSLTLDRHDSNFQLTITNLPDSVQGENEFEVKEECHDFSIKN